MPSIGSFCLIKNEIKFIQAHLNEWLEHLDCMVFFDSNSTDGTLEVLRRYANNHSKIILLENKDPKDLKDDYVKMSNDALHTLWTDLAIFMHPDFFPENPEVLRQLPDDMIAATFNVKSFAGEPGGPIYEIKGRGNKWKDIYRLHNPDLGAHYFGHYGAHEEDIYFSEITGEDHESQIEDFTNYPYPIIHSDLVIRHYSDIRPYARRLERMERCLINQGHTPEIAKMLAPKHPRVTLQDGNGFTFVEAEMPAFMEGK